MTAENIRRVIVTGRVQGVGFRAFVAHEARRLRVEGWVRNRHDGRVEAVFAGNPSAVDDLVAACRNGPVGARVTEVTESSANASDLLARPDGVAFAVLS
jgi:acylphosphatase